MIYRETAREQRKLRLLSSPVLIAARRLTGLELMRGGDVTYGPVPVATGKVSAPTAPGTFHVTWKDLHHRSSEFHNAPMPYSVFFNGGDAFHEGSVTVRANGCVHLTQPAQTFYNTLRVGDEVQVVG